MPTHYDTLEWLKRLVAHDTTFDNSNLPLIEEIRQHLLEWGFSCQRSFDDAGRKANLFATIGDAERPGIILSGHTDVVPANAEQWTSEPYRLRVSDGRAYGRGACDMKGFLAVVLGMVPQLSRASHDRTFHLAFSYDEEIGCVGARRLMPIIASLPARPSGCIVGEPTSMQVFVGHKGKSSYRVRVRGCECHSSMPQNGVNAVEIGAELVSQLAREARQRREQQLPSKFDPPFTTIHTGTIRGGTALNIVPGECFFDFEMRNLPGESTRDVVDRLTSKATVLMAEKATGFEQAGVDIEVKTSYPGLATPEDHPFVTRIGSALRSSKKYYASFGTEGGLFSEMGIPSVVLGPGSIAQAHKPDEFVSLDQLARCESSLQSILFG
jgi:acetylornithine deacetylase